MPGGSGCDRKEQLAIRTAESRRHDLLCLDVATGEVVVHSPVKPAPYALDEARLHVPVGHVEPVHSTPDVSHAERLHSPLSLIEQSPNETGITEHASDVTKRFVLRLAPAPQRVASGRRPTWSGAALIIGDNPVAIQLESRLRSAKSQSRAGQEAMIRRRWPRALTS